MPGKTTLADVEVLGRVRAVPVPATSKSIKIVSRRAVLMGWSLRESTGSAKATVEIIDGSSANDNLMASIAIASGGDDRIGLGPLGICADGGIYLSVLSGSVTGAIWVSVEE